MQQHLAPYQKMEYTPDPDHFYMVVFCTEDLKTSVVAQMCINYFDYLTELYDQQVRSTQTLPISLTVTLPFTKNEMEYIHMLVRNLEATDFGEQLIYPTIVQKLVKLLTKDKLSLSAFGNLRHVFKNQNKPKLYQTYNIDDIENYFSTTNDDCQLLGRYYDVITHPWALEIIYFISVFTEGLAAFFQHPKDPKDMMLTVVIKFPQPIHSEATVGRRSSFAPEKDTVKPYFTPDFLERSTVLHKQELFGNLAKIDPHFRNPEENLAQKIKNKFLNL